MSQLPRIEDVPGLPTTDLAHVLDLLFEPSTQLHTLCVDRLRSQPMASYNELVSIVGLLLTELSQSSSTSDTDWLHAILGSHPRLGGAKVDSTQSQGEQAQLQGGGEQEAALLAELNARYESAFPGLRFVTFVNGRARPAIMDEMRSRIQRNDIRQEEADAIKAMCDIAADRAAKLSPSTT